MKVLGEIDIRNLFFIDLQNRKISNFHDFDNTHLGIHLLYNYTNYLF